MPPEDFMERLIVIYDDTDLAPGQIRIRQRGSAGGHNGMKNILYQLETDEFLRIRIGIGRRPEDFTQSNFVLSRFSKSEEDAAIKGIIAAADAMEDILRHGASYAMNKYNAKPKHVGAPKEEENEEKQTIVDNDSNNDIPGGLRQSE
jgi:PTH1 family peptidyl-tRNA hydrolase